VRERGGGGRLREREKRREERERKRDGRWGGGACGAARALSYANSSTISNVHCAGNGLPSSTSNSIPRLFDAFGVGAVPLHAVRLKFSCPSDVAM